MRVKKRRKTGGGERVGRIKEDLLGWAEDGYLAGHDGCTRKQKKSREKEVGKRMTSKIKTRKIYTRIETGFMCITLSFSFRYPSLFIFKPRRHQRKDGGILCFPSFFISLQSQCNTSPTHRTTSVREEEKKGLCIRLLSHSHSCLLCSGYGLIVLWNIWGGGFLLVFNGGWVLYGRGFLGTSLGGGRVGGWEIIYIHIYNHVCVWMYMYACVRVWSLCDAV